MMMMIIIKIIIIIKNEEVSSFHSFNQSSFEKNDWLIKNVVWLNSFHYKNDDNQPYYIIIPALKRTYTNDMTHWSMYNDKKSFFFVVV